MHSRSIVLNEEFTFHFEGVDTCNAHSNKRFRDIVNSHADFYSASKEYQLNCLQQLQEQFKGTLEAEKIEKIIFKDPIYLLLLPKDFNGDIEIDLDTSKRHKGGLFDSYLPLHFAVWSGCIKAVEELMAIDADCIHAQFNSNLTVMHIAASRGHDDLINLLFNYNIPINQLTTGHFENMTPIGLAAREGQNMAIQALVNLGTPIETDDENYYSPIHFAAQHGRPDTIRLLVQLGADIDKLGAFNRTAVSMTCWSLGNNNEFNQRRAMALRELSRLGANLNKQTKHESYIVFEAMKLDCVETLTTLLDCGANLKTKNNKLLKSFLYVAAQTSDFTSATKYVLFKYMFANDVWKNSASMLDFSLALIEDKKYSQVFERAMKFLASIKMQLHVICNFEFFQYAACQLTNVSADNILLLPTELKVQLFCHLIEAEHGFPVEYTEADILASRYDFSNKLIKAHNSVDSIFEERQSSSNQNSLFDQNLTNQLTNNAPRLRMLGPRPHR